MDYVTLAAMGTVFADMIDPTFWATGRLNKLIRMTCCQSGLVRGGKPVFYPNNLVDRGWGAFIVGVTKDLLSP